jgi:hypothetical protein
MGRTAYRGSKMKRTPAKDKGRLLLVVKSVPESPPARREPRLPACEASALTTELTAPNRTYFSPQDEPCKDRLQTDTA